MRYRKNSFRRPWRFLQSEYERISEALASWGGEISGEEQQRKLTSTLYVHGKCDWPRPLPIAPADRQWKLEFVELYLFHQWWVVIPAASAVEFRTREKLNLQHVDHSLRLIQLPIEPRQRLDDVIRRAERWCVQLLSSLLRRCHVVGEVGQLTRGALDLSELRFHLAAVAVGETRQRLCVGICWPPSDRL